MNSDQKKKIEVLSSDDMKKIKGGDNVIIIDIDQM